MSIRPPAPAPDIPGYALVRFLGSGGFSDVHVYQQLRPHRSVAVKVLRPDAVNPETLARFESEANLMAALSSHPAIVTIYEAEVSRDGRPYIVMEYCSRPNLSARYRAERLTAAEVLRIGVQLAGAVESTHRAGILHRDIKPSNVLTTDFGRPALSDFGISVHRSDVDPGAGAVGLSIPWSPPEVFEAAVPSDERADIYSLAATLYTALAMRSPFDRPGGPNGTADLIARIRTAPLPALGRGDVPGSLERVLSRAMDKNPAARYATALDFARALQQVETEMRLAPTEIDIRDDHPELAGQQVADSPATKVRALTVIEAQPAAPAPLAPTGGGEIPSFSLPQTTGSTSGLTGPGYGTGTTGAGIAPELEYTHLRAHPGAAPAPQPTRSRRWLPFAALGAAVVVAATTVTIVLATRGTSPSPAPQSPDAFGTTATGAMAAAPAAVQKLKGEVTTIDGESRAVFTWQAPQLRSGDTFHWVRTDTGAGSNAKDAVVAHPTVRISRNPQTACIAVRVVGSDGQSSDVRRACVGD